MMTTWIAFAAGYLLCFVTLLWTCLWSVKMTLRLTGQPDRLGRRPPMVAPRAGKDLTDPVDDALPGSPSGPRVQRFAGKAVDSSPQGSTSGRR